MSGRPNVQTAMTMDDSSWPAAASCNGYKWLEPCKAAIGSTRPTAVTRLAAEAMAVLGHNRPFRKLGDVPLGWLLHSECGRSYLPSW
jgi:hypothetical protein